MNIFIFNRSLRLQDNLGLIESCKSNKTIPIFIFTPEQVINNKYGSDKSILFMIECLFDLNKQLIKKNSKLHIFFGDYKKVINNIIKEIKIKNIFMNADYSPYAIQRSKDIKKICDKNNLGFYDEFDDCLLFELGDLRNKSEDVYKKFTPFYDTYKNKKPNKPIPFSLVSLRRKETREKGLIKKQIKNEIKLSEIYNIIGIEKKKLIFKGGRKYGKYYLKKANSIQYSKTRNYLEYETTRLSPYLKFGCISIREAYFYIRSKELKKQLFWREFFIYVMYFLTAGKPLRKTKLRWYYPKNKKDKGWDELQKWKKGETGIPIIDAGMRELNTTGYMHNRARLITSDFLVKTLKIHWEIGEQYFASKLIDYDISSNNGNWQWIAGVGTDYQPYNRYFNPWRQSKKYDPDTTYIKKYIPELKNVPSKDIHNWFKKYKNYNVYISPPNLF